MNLDNIEGDFDYVGPNLLVYEVRNKKKFKTLAGQIFNWGAMQFSS